MKSDECTHEETDTYYHTSEDGEVTSKIYCVNCGMEWG